MANEEHLNILSQSPKTWNEWRLNNRAIHPDLRNANLSIADLRCLNLSESDLSGANLARSDFSGALRRRAEVSGILLGKIRTNEKKLSTHIERADLTGAILKGANLRGADLTSVDLTGAHLGGADLSEAVLRGADLSRAHLSGADFNKTVVGFTRFVNVNLREVRGLETLIHWGPSEISISTIYRSQGKIPLEFLRGIGAPENFITYMSSLVGTSLEYYSCFISYASKNHEFAERLYADLQNKGVRCWFAPEDLEIGAKLRTAFDDAILLHDKLMVILSEHSVKSQWVEKEVETACEKERHQNRIVLFPIRLDDAVMETQHAWAADIRRTRHIGDFRDWKNHDSYWKAFDRLLRDLRAESASAAKIET